MAIFSSYLLGQAKNSVGNVVMFRAKKKNIARGKSLSVKNPRTQGQVQQRLRMSTLIRLATRFAAVIMVGFRKNSLPDARNEFIKRNMGKVSVDEQNVVTIDAKKLVCSAGSLGRPSFSAELDAETGVIRFSKSEQVLMPYMQNMDDEVYAVVFESVAEEVLVCRLGERGVTDPVEMPLPENWVKENITVYGFAVNKKKTGVSETGLIPLK